MGAAGDPEKCPGDPCELQASSAGRAAVQSGLPKSPRPPPPTWIFRGTSEWPWDSGGSKQTQQTWCGTGCETTRGARREPGDDLWGAWPFCRLWLRFILIHSCVYLTLDPRPRACKSNKFLAPASFFKKYKRGSYIKKLINIHPATTAWNICVLSSFIKLHQSVF